MTITVLDTATAMADVLAADPAERPDRVRTMLAPMAGMFRFVPGEVDLLAMHRMSLGFPIDRDTGACREALDQLRAADAWSRIEQALGEAIAVQAAAVPALVVPDITVLLLLGDPGDAFFSGPARGLSGSGGITGYITLTLWPTEENLDRLEASAVHELHHNLRYAPGGVVWDPNEVTVGEHVVSEGLADAFARQLYGDERGYSPIGVEHLDDDAVLAKVLTGLDVRGMHNFGGWVLGDAAAERFGAEPVGLPTGAGYAVGNRLVDSYLAATGHSPAQALHVPSADVIAAARDRP